MKYLKIIYSIVLTISFLHPKPGEAQINSNWRWAKNTASWPFVVDEQGNTYIIGEFSDSISFNNNRNNIILYGNNTNLYLEKIGPQGNILWAKTGYDSSIYPTAAAIDQNGNIYINGEFGDYTSDNGAKIMCYDTSGRHIWTDVIQGDGAAILAQNIQSDSGGNLVATENVLEYYHNNYNLRESYGHFIRLDHKGTILSTVILYIDPAWDEDLENMALDKFGNTYIEYTQDDGNGTPIDSQLVYWLLKYDRTGNLSWKKGIVLSFNCSSFGDIKTDKYGNLYFSGTTYSCSGNFFGVNIPANTSFMIKTDSSAKAIWSETFDSNFIYNFPDKNGNSYVAINSFYYTATQIAKYNSNGIKQWTATVGSPLGGYIQNLRCNDFGDITISGKLDENANSSNLPYYAYFGIDTLVCPVYNNPFMASTSCHPPTAKISNKGGDTIKGYNSILLSTPKVQGYTYQWLRNGVVIPNEDSNTIYANLQGIYRVEVVSGDCPSADEKTIYGAITGIKNINAEQFGLNIYPNPVTSSCAFTAEFNLPAQENANVVLYNTDGEIITEQLFRSQSAGRQKVFLQVGKTLRAGIYFLRVITPIGQAAVPVMFSK